MACSNYLCLPSDEVDVVYFVVLLIANTLNCLVALASVYLIARRAFAPPAVRTPNRDVPLSVVVPCYLPNEQEIISGTVSHILHKLEYAGPLTLWVVYNTPDGSQAEEARVKRLDGTAVGLRTVRVLKAEASTSKAENLNMVMKLIKDQYVALYDADHHPDPSSLNMLMEQMERTGSHAVQGSTYIRSTKGSLMAKAVNAEFFVTHFVYFPAMEVLASVGYFGGSNALWRTEVLRRYPFDEGMHTEDVDLSARVILDNHRICFCPLSRSGELPPAGVRSFVHQRLRWFIGWEQVTHKYYWSIFWSPLSLVRKLGFCYMFHLRWLLLLAAVMVAVVNPILTSPFVYPLPTWSVAIQICVYTAACLYATVAILGITTAIWTRDKASTVLWVIVFFAFGWLYVILHFSLQLFAFIKVFTGQVGDWQVTIRADEGTPSVGPSPNRSSTNLHKVSSGGGLSALRQPLLPT